MLNPTVAGDTLDISLDPSGNWFNFDYGYDYTDPSILRLADPGGWGGDRWQAGYLKDMFIEDKLNAARVDFDYAFSRGASQPVRSELRRTNSPPRTRNLVPVCERPSAMPSCGSRAMRRRSPGMPAAGRCTWTSSHARRDLFLSPRTIRHQQPN